MDGQITRRASISAALAAGFCVFAFFCPAPLPAVIGFALGIVFQRTDFCFSSAFRELFTKRRARMALGLLAALAAGTIGYTIVFGARLPDPTGPYVPDTAFIGRAGWHMALGGLAFGLGMGIAGNCISSALYRIGEGSTIAIAVLVGALIGFLIGYQAWPFLWSRVISTAPAVWFPHDLGYTIALGLQLAVIAGLALFLLWKFPAESATPAEPATLPVVARRIFVDRWPAWMGGLCVGVIATAAYLRTSPLGVTAEIARIARSIGGLPARIDGLDSIAGCRPSATPGISDNGWLVLSLVWGSLCAAVVSGRFRPRLGPPMAYLRVLGGGVLLGFGAMIAVGCTVGALLSGVMALSLHGWIFAAALFAGAWAATRIVDRGSPLR